MTLFGYTGHVLKIDLSTGVTTLLSTAEYADRFIGGRGLAAKLYWDMVPPRTKAFDPDNCLICTTGPVAGFPGFAGSRWQVCGKSFRGNAEVFSYGNLGGKWGVALKETGYDALVVHGQAEKPVYIFIDNGMVHLKDATYLWGKTTFDTTHTLKTQHGQGVSVLTIGPAAENMISFATIFAEEGASGSGGLGAVMGAKKLKAVVVAGNQKPRAAHPDKVRDLASRIRKIIKIAPYDRTMWAVPGRSKLHICYGCGLGCGRHVYPGEKGRKYKSFCQATEVYYGPGPIDEEPRTEAHLLGTRLCDGYGLDTAVLYGMILWIASSYGDNLITEKQIGLPLSKIGTPEFIEDLIHKIIYKKGFGRILAGGTIRAADYLGGKAKERIGYYVGTQNSETKDYDPRLMPVTALLYATEPRRPIQQLHEPLSYLRRWLEWARGEGDRSFTSDHFRRLAEKRWGNAIAADFTTLEGKAQAAIKIQERAYVKESLILCDLSWMGVWAKYLGDNLDQPALENQIYSAITGHETDEAGMNRIGSRLYNMQRAVQIRHGWPGRQGDRLMAYYHRQPLKRDELFCDPECIVPGKDGEIADVTGTVVDKDNFEKMKSEFYYLRGWDAESGLPTKAVLEDLDLKDVAEDLASCGLAK
jgi:aldehyde:ferredoxin oxidoreductase